jgi:hypothetical protein
MRDDPPYGLDEPQQPLGPDPEVARGRVKAPAIFLIVVGALNLLAALWQLGEGALLLAKSPDQLHKEAVEESKQIFGALIQDPDLQKKMMEQVENQDPRAQYNQGLLQGFGGGIVLLIISLLTLFGAIRMMSLRSYGLAMTGAILAAIPCISPSACCLLGAIAGIWAVIVLMNNDVKSAFR